MCYRYSDIMTVRFLEHCLIRPSIISPLSFVRLTVRPTYTVLSIKDRFQLEIVAKYSQMVRQQTEIKV